MIQSRASARREVVQLAWADETRTQMRGEFSQVRAQPERRRDVGEFALFRALCIYHWLHAPQAWSSSTPDGPFPSFPPHYPLAAAAQRVL
jgi:hypothetical protein